jgi:hypothetical protein
MLPNVKKHHTPESTASASYVPPRLIRIGAINDVVLGVAGGGDDFMGFSGGQFEFQADGGDSNQLDRFERSLAPVKQ